MKTKIVLKKNVIPSDVEVVFCLSSKKENTKSYQKIFHQPHKKEDLVIIKPKTSQDIIQRIQEAIAEGSFLAKPQQILLLRGCGTQTKHTLVIGLGEITQPVQQGKETCLCFEVFRRSGAYTFKALNEMKVFTAQCDFQHLNVSSGQHTEQIMQAFLEGFYLASYQFEDHLSDEKKSSHVFKTLTVVAQNPSIEASLTKAMLKANHITEGVNFARWLADQPGNIITPVTLAQEVQKKFKGTKTKVTVWDEKRIQKERMGLLYGVGQGSKVESRLIVMEYKGTKNKTAPICLVGKGITFDSGGISIKPSRSMEEMKYDMCGAASVVGTLLALEQLKAKVHVIGIVASAENMPGSAATKPGDIHYSRKGLSVEVFNTDAEGRLALGDALCFATEQKPQLIVDVATLTGAIVVALGNYHAGYFVQNEDLAKNVKKALQATQEDAWRMPLVEGHRRSMKGMHADLKNISDGDKPGAGSATAAAFLSYFVGDGIPWVHFDIAGVAYHVGHLHPYCPKKGGSGIMVRTFCQLVIDSFQKP